MTDSSLSNQKLNLIFPANASKAPSYDYIHDWNERLAQEDINWTSLVTFLDTDFVEKHKSLDSSCSSDEVKVSSTTHRVYISLEGSTKFLSDIDIKTTERSLGKLNLVHGHWVHYFWTNNADNVDARIKAIPGIKIIDFFEFSGHPLYNIAMDLVEKTKINSNPSPLLTQIADIFRLLAMQKYGGIYMDNNVVIIDPFKLYEVTKKFSIALTQEGGEEHNDKNDPSLVTKVEQKDVANNIIIATPNHEVVNDTIDLALRNFGKTEVAPPLYVSRGSDLSNNLAYEAGPCALSIGFFNYVNKQIALGNEGNKLECGPWKVLLGDLTPSDYVLSLSLNGEDYVCGFYLVQGS